MKKEDSCVDWPVQKDSFQLENVPITGIVYFVTKVNVLISNPWNLLVHRAMVVQPMWSVLKNVLK